MKKWYRKLYKLIVGRKNPVRYAKKIGVNFGSGFRVFGRVEWSTEPWIITFGDNVYITDGVKFLTHDGPAYAVMPAASVRAAAMKTAHVFFVRYFKRFLLL